MDHSFEYRQNLRRERLARKERAAYLRRARALACMLTVAFLVIGTIAANAIIAKAGDGHKERYVKYYTSIMVQKGDTVSGIAAEHLGAGYESIDELVKEIGFINGLDDTYTIQSDTILIIPYYGAAN